MRASLLFIACVLGAIFAFSLAASSFLEEKEEKSCPLCPGPNCPIKPKPKPVPKPKKPWGPHLSQAVGLAPMLSARYPLRDEDDEEEEDQSSFVNGREYDKEVLTADFPGSLYMSNIGSKRDGAGMCVMTSITMLARYLGLWEYYELRDWCAREPGGAWREKVEDQIKRYEKAKGVKYPISFLQYEGKDPVPLLDALDKANLPFAHTYGWSPRYKQRISHMVANVKFNGRMSVVLDNNPMTDFDPPSNKIFEWMTREEMIRRAKLGGGNMWVFAWLAPPPPPCPK